MRDAVFSPSWYRVAHLKPALGSHVRVQRHRYGGGAWYVLEDPVTGRTHRLNPAAYAFAGRLDGTRTLDAIWLEVAEAFQEGAPTQDDALSLLAQLHGADLLRPGTAPDVHELVERRRRGTGTLLRQNLINPTSIRLPLFDPDRLLGALLPFVRLFIGVAGFLLWLAVVLPAVVLAGRHWGELTGNLSDLILSYKNLAVLVFSYPVIKALHELGHGLVAKRFGAAVNECGALFLVFLPMPYVDVSGVAAFRSKWQRMAVGGAGILVETLLAALALYGWVALQPGVERAILYNIIVIGSVSTILVNGNPLIRFDGYYVLADFLEVPNLAQRASRYIQYVTETRLFGNDAVRRAQATTREKIIFLLYAPASFVYRLMLTASIGIFIAKRYFVVGVACAVWMVAQTLLLPIAKGLWAVAAAPRLRRVRPRALSVVGGGVLVAAVLLFAVPAPSWSLAEGVVWLPDDAVVRAGTSGFLRAMASPDGSAVAPGDRLVELEAPALDAKIAGLQWKVRELETKLGANVVNDRVLAETTRIELDNARAQALREVLRRAKLTGFSPASGRFLAARPAADLPGRFFKEGELIGYVVPDAPQRVRVAVTQDAIDRVRNALDGIELAFADATPAVPSRVLRAVPAGLFQLPAAALSRAAGGPIPTDPRDTKNETSLARVFQFDLDLPPAARSAPFGARVHVKFRHRPEAVGLQLYRRLRQLFLASFDV